MTEHRRRRRRSVQLYSEPSPWGVLAAIGLMVALIVVVLVVLGSDVVPTLFSFVGGGLRVV